MRTLQFVSDVLIADDIEVPNNSATQGMRDKLSEAVKEFDAILKPNGRIIYLGTPQLHKRACDKGLCEGKELQERAEQTGICLYFNAVRHKSQKRTYPRLFEAQAG